MRSKCRLSSLPAGGCPPLIKDLGLDSANETTLTGIPRRDLEVLVKGVTGVLLGSVQFGVRRFA